MPCESRKCQFLVWRWVLLKKVIPKNFRWRASVIHAKYKRVLSEKGGDVFALSQWITRTRLSRSLEQATMLVKREQRCFPLQGKKIELFFNAKSATEKHYFFCFTAITGLPRGWKPAICPLREEDFLFFPLSAERKTQNGLMTGHSYEMFVHSKQSKAKRELLLRLTFQK